MSARVASLVLTLIREYSASMQNADAALETFLLREIRRVRSNRGEP